MLEIINLHKIFHNNRVLNGIDLSFDRGGLWTILGPNASGKTTLIKSILGIVVPSSGDIRIKGESVLNSWEYKRSINYLPQIANFPENLTVSELIKLTEELYGAKSNQTNLIDRFDLTAHMNKKIANLSGGTKQKVNLVMSLLFENPIYIFDEPTAGLDPLALIELKQVFIQLKKQNRIVLVTTHIISLVEEIADNIIFLLDGKIRFIGSVKKLKSAYKSNSLESSIAALLLD